MTHYDTLFIILLPFTIHYLYILISIWHHLTLIWERICRRDPFKTREKKRFSIIGLAIPTSYFIIHSRSLLLCRFNETLTTRWWFQPPAPARHKCSQGIKLYCIAWVGSAEANHPVHAWCNANIQHASHAGWTLRVMLIFWARICIIQHRSALLLCFCERRRDEDQHMTLH